MTSLYNRATPCQAKVLKIIEGAVRNAEHAHKWNFPARAPRSIAKRAAGTLTAQWPEVLAAAGRSSSELATGRLVFPKPNVGCEPVANQQRRAAHLRSRLARLQLVIGSMAGQARRDGSLDRHAALVEVLRLMAAIT